MAKVDKPIVAARFTDEGMDHACIMVHGDDHERMISKKDHPHVWSEMLRSVVLHHYQADAVATIPVASHVVMGVTWPTSANAATPALAPFPVRQALAPPPLLQLPDPRVAQLEARIRELESRPKIGEAVDLDAIANQVAAALGDTFAHLQNASAPTNHEARLAEVENILLSILHHAKTAA